MQEKVMTVGSYQDHLDDKNSYLPGKHSSDDVENSPASFDRILGGGGGDITDNKSYNQEPSGGRSSFAHDQASFEKSG